MKYTDEIKELGIHKFKNINAEELFRKVFCYSPKYRLEYIRFIENGYSGWPTWFIIFDHNESFQWNEVVTICSHTGFNKRFFTDFENFDLNKFIKELERTDNIYQFFEDYPFNGNANFEVNQSVRLYNALKEYGIEIFEPKN